MVGKFGEFGESSVIRQTLTSQILASNSTLWPKSIHSPNFISPITFNSVFRQTLTPPNIPAIRYIVMDMSKIVLWVLVYLKYANVKNFALAVF